MRVTTASRGKLVRALWPALALVAVCAAACVAGNAESVGTGSERGGAEFGTALAIADFDGDQRPDLATVSIDQAHALSTDYLIRLRFSAAPEATIGLTAKGGGLDLSPRDV